MEDRLKKWIFSHEVLLAISGALISSVAYAFTNFATIKYVDNKHDQVVEILTDIRDSVQKIDDRTWELSRRSKKGDR